MKKNILLILSLLVAGSISALAAGNTVTTKYKFAAHSPLAEGKWVRISIGETGVYEITYDQLREMGFSDPSKVAVYGQPGTQRDVNFMSSTNVRLVEDNLEPVRVLHKNNKVLFYGEGTAKLNFRVTGYSPKEVINFTRESKSIYSERAYYFLTDSHPMATVPQLSVSDKNGAETQAFGYTCVYHEKDLVQGVHLSGQKFWGENLQVGTPLSFPVSVPYSVPEQPCMIATDVALMKNQTGTLYLGLGDFRLSTAINSWTSKITTITKNSSNFKLDVDANNVGTSDVNFSLTGSYSTDSPCGIDYWTLTCPISLEYARSDNNFSQQYICFTAPTVPSGSSANTYAWKHAVPDNAIVWNITSHQAPEALEVNGGWFYHDKAVRTEVVAFDPAKPQKTIGNDYEEVINQNLHGLQGQGADMVIFTTPDLKSYAERIATLHEEHLGDRVLVVTPQQVYDEFTSGTPDPMAYRLLAKMLYQSSGRKLKNVLMMGPIYSDYRNVRGADRTSEGHIAYQQDLDNLTDTTPACIMDYYGIMTDRVLYPDNLESAAISIGVGLLPINSSEEGELAVAKIKEYLEKDDFSGLVNETMTIGCAGDNYLHLNQAIRLGQLYQSNANESNGSKFAHETVCMESLGTKKMNDNIHIKLNKGKLLTTYFGHAGTSGFDGFTVKDVVTSDNPELGFLFLAACDLCRPDNCEHGIGDMSVIRAKRGFIGTVCATRSVQSNYNDNLMRNLVNSLFLDDNDMNRKSTPTAGEVYARSKDRAANTSEIAYIYVGDPGLPLPVALGRLRLDVTEGQYMPGDVVEVKGYVVDDNGYIRTECNGYATVKLMAPTRTIEEELKPNEKGELEVVREEIEFNDMRLTAVKTKVNAGEFTARIIIPEECASYQNASEPIELVLLGSAYDTTTRLGSSGVGSLPLASADYTPSEDQYKDNTAPSITLSYDKTMQVVKVTVTDDTAIIPGIGQGCGSTMTMDDVTIELPHEFSDEVGVTEYNTGVSVAALGKGTHTARCSTTDVAGNHANAELTFVIEENARPVLTADKSIAIDEISFSVITETDQPLILLVSDADGNIVEQCEFTGANYQLDTTELPTGRYSAAVRAASAAGSRIYSDWLHFTVID